jgi:membrane protein
VKEQLALLRTVAAEAGRDNVPFLAAAIAFYSMISIAPLFVISISVAGLFFGAEAAQGEVYAQLRALMGPEGAAIVEDMIRRSREPGTGLLATALGVGMLLVGASWLFGALEKAFDVIWDLEPRPDQSWLATLRDYFLSVLMVAGTGFLLLTTLVVSAGIALMMQFFGRAVPLGEALLTYGVSQVGGFAITALIFGVIIKSLSNVHLAWRDVVIGAIVTGLLFTFGRFLIGEYLGRGSFTSVYGAAGSLAVLLLWVYYSAQILCLGAEFTKVYARARGVRPAPRMGRRLIPRQQRGQGVVEAVRCSDEPGGK